MVHSTPIRGTNEFEDHDIVIILGREQPSPRDAESRAMAIWYDTRKPIGCILAGAEEQAQYPYRVRQYTMRGGSQRPVNVRVHPDARVQAVVEQVREAEMVQAIDGLRLIHSARQKTVFVLCNIPLEIPVDRLVTWRELVGDDRLASALAVCDERGWDALPLAPKELCRLFPDLWETKKAAERWTAKNPPEAYRDLIRVWGVLNTYRPPGQTSWSKALVRHGAEPGVALAEVLNLSPGEIQVREGAAAEPPTMASTAPRPRPSNPTPNKAVAEPSNGGPGFPSGDN